MADFKTHIVTSSIVGAAYGVVAHTEYGIPIPTCLIASGLCGLAGMLPDIDSDTGNSQREIMSFTAAITPMLMLDHLASMDLTTEEIVIATASVYIVVRFGLGELLRRYTVHRGMFHSVPAALIAGLITALACVSSVPAYELTKVLAMILGYLVHLILDEIWSLEARRGKFRVKRSFGTALKFFGNHWFPNAVTYGLLLVLGSLAYQESSLPQYLQSTPMGIEQRVDDPFRQSDEHRPLGNLGQRGDSTADQRR